MTPLGPTATNYSSTTQESGNKLMRARSQASTFPPLFGSFSPASQTSDRPSGSRSSLTFFTKCLVRSSSMTRSRPCSRSSTASAPSVLRRLRRHWPRPCAGTPPPLSPRHQRPLTTSSCAISTLLRRLPWKIHPLHPRPRRTASMHGVFGTSSEPFRAR